MVKLWQDCSNHIHKAQGLTLNKAIIDIGKKELSIGLTFVASSRLCHLKDLLFHPIARNGIRLYCTCIVQALPITGLQAFMNIINLS